GRGRRRGLSFGCGTSSLPPAGAKSKNEHANLERDAMKLVRYTLFAAVAVIVHAPVSAQDELEFLLEGSDAPEAQNRVQAPEPGTDEPPEGTDAALPPAAPAAAAEIYDEVVPVAPAEPVESPSTAVAARPPRSRQLEEIIVTAQKKTS